MVVETASSANGFKKLPPAAASDVEITANQETSNDPLTSLSDGKLEAEFGPVFANGIRNGAYKMDLGAVRSVSAITSWSFNRKGIRGAQKLVLYGSGAAADPGSDMPRASPTDAIVPGLLDR